MVVHLVVRLRKVINVKVQRAYARQVIYIMMNFKLILVCGDGIIVDGWEEECEDGNLQNGNILKYSLNFLGDGCSSEC